MSVPQRVIRERLVESLHAARDHDAYWGIRSAGRRHLHELTTAAGRGHYVERERVRRVLDELVDAGEVEVDETLAVTNETSWRWPGPVVPVGGDERMAQP